MTGVNVITSYHRADPDTATGYKVILTQVFCSYDEKEIDAIENAFKKQYGSGTIIKCEITDDESGVKYATI